MKQYNITIVSTGYVGMFLALLLVQKHMMYVKDAVREKIDVINSGGSPIHEDYIDTWKNKMRAASDSRGTYAEAEFTVVAVQTNYDASKKFLYFYCREGSERSPWRK